MQKKQKDKLMRKKSKQTEFVERSECVLKVRKIFELGYLPARKDQAYHIICEGTQVPYARQMNCFSHACLNLTNEQLDKLKLDNYDTYVFDIKSYQYQPKEEIAKTFPKRLKRFGLIAKHCDKEENSILKNQWKVALYFGFSRSTLDYDYHFLKQEEDGTWTSKIGWSNGFEILDSIPDIYHSPSGTDYHLDSTYIITNPYAETEKTSSNIEQTI